MQAFQVVFDLECCHLPNHLLPLWPSSCTGIVGGCDYIPNYHWVFVTAAIHCGFHTATDFAAWTVMTFLNYATLKRLESHHLD